MSSPNTAKQPVVFVHGLWLHAESWNPWVEQFRAKGYDAVTASWPGDAATTQATRQNASAVAGFGVSEIADHIAQQLKRFDRKPVLIGHSFGGLLVQNLLGRDLAAAAIALDPAPIQGVWELPFSALRSAFPALGNPFNYSRAVSLTQSQFRFAFTNAVPESEAAELFAKFAMPAPARPLFQAATASFTPGAATRVNTRNNARGPLLLVSGEEDHTVPPVLVRSTLRQYKGSTAVTELKAFAGRGHSLTIDHGWREVADYCADWIKQKGFAA
jgi:pimeloyl-ACP methyl ester carboxylesterase